MLRIILITVAVFLNASVVAVTIELTSEDDGTSEIPDSTLKISVPSVNRCGELARSASSFVVIFDSDSGVTLDEATLEVGLAAKQQVSDITHLFTFQPALGELRISGNELKAFYDLLDSQQAIMDISAYDNLGHDISIEIRFELK